jgi:hypothetical protein
MVARGYGSLLMWTNIFSAKCKSLLAAPFFSLSSVAAGGSQPLLLHKKIVRQHERELRIPFHTTDIEHPL